MEARKSGELQFKQALSQVNWYMQRNDTRYGFIITDKELVPIRRVNVKGHLELAASIPWGACGQHGEDKLTVLLALWYLGTLISNGNGEWDSSVYTYNTDPRALNFMG